MLLPRFGVTLYALLMRFLQNRRLRGAVSFLNAGVLRDLTRPYVAKAMKFIQRRNSLTSEMEWEAEETDYDYFREIARSSYADMLHDTERNKMYFKAIKSAVKEVHRRGQKAKVLDIGTGTGLLSMMAASVGAEQITAIEVFDPMARVAKEITKANGYGFIKVINKHSTDVQLGEDMEEKANILVTELFDTELIGEGALVAYHHAHQNLMEKDSIAVPHSATTYVQVVESDLMHSWHALKSIKIIHKDGHEDFIEPDPSMSTCPGVPAVHDIQLSQVKQSQFKEITSAVEVFHFDWNSKCLSAEPKRNTIKTRAVCSGTAQVFLSWWTLSMDVKGEVTLSTAPYWFHPSPTNMQWRDHWIQSVYFMPKPLQVFKGDEVVITACHDSYSMWFDASRQELQDTNGITHPICSYLPRMLWSRPRLGMLNDKIRNNSIIRVLQDVDFTSKNHTTLCISDVSLLPLFVACFSKGQIFSLECGKIAQRGIQNLVKHNKMSDRITVIDSETCSECNLPIPVEGLDLLISEPFFMNSLPWLDLQFWYKRTALSKYLSPKTRIVPFQARLCMAALQFDDLWKIRAPVHQVEGFDVSIMDDMISHAMETEDFHEPEPHSLWEYPNRLLSTSQHVLSFDFTEPVPSEEKVVSGKIQLNESTGVCHGVALWMEYYLTKDEVLSTGLMKDLTWTMHFKQGVFFLREPVSVSCNQQNMQYEISFTPQMKSIQMKFLADNSS